MDEDLKLLKIFEDDTIWLHNNLSSLRSKFEDNFVAVKDKGVIANGKEIQDVINILEKKNLNPSFIVIEFVHKKGVELIL